MGATQKWQEMSAFNEWLAWVTDVSDATTEFLTEREANNTSSRSTAGGTDHILELFNHDKVHGGSLSQKR